MPSTAAEARLSMWSSATQQWTELQTLHGAGRHRVVWHVPDSAQGNFRPRVEYPRSNQAADYSKAFLRIAEPLVASDASSVASDATAVAGSEVASFDADVPVLTLSPNPAGETVTLSWPAGYQVLELVAATGEVVYAASLQATESSRDLDVNRIAGGAYYVRLSSGVHSAPVIAKLMVSR